MICGGVLSETEHQKNVSLYGIWADTMSWVTPDKWFAEYLRAISKSNDPKYGRDRRRAEAEYADKIFTKHARSQI